jgi:histidinol phosphatase-like enzyme
MLVQASLAATLAVCDEPCSGLAIRAAAAPGRIAHLQPDCKSRAVAAVPSSHNRSQDCRELISLRKDHPIDAPVIFLDLDSALVELRPSGLPRPDLILRSNAEEGLRRLREAGRVVVLVDPSARDQLLPHQSDLRASFARRNLRGALTKIAIFSCRHRRGEACACRKPGLDLIERARDELGLELAGGWIVGGEMDIAAGREVGLRTVRIGPATVGRAGPTLTADYDARDLLDAANWILLSEALAA